MSARQAERLPSPLITRLIGYPIATDVAIVGPDGVAGGAGTYGAIGARARALSNVLRGDRASLDGARVVFLVPATLAYVDTLLAIFLAGGCAVPLSPLQSASELAHAIDLAQPTVLMATQDLAPRLADAGAGRPLVLVDAPQTAIHREAAHIAARDPALMLFTSGTTAKPKGVVLSHGAVAASLSALESAWGWSRRDRLLHVLPLHHTHGVIVALLGALWCGATARLEPFHAERVWELLADATVFMAVPTIHHKLMEAFKAADAAKQARWRANAAQLRLVTSGSAALPVSLLTAFEAATGQRILERYGMTEIGIPLSNPLRGERTPGAVGRPLAGVQVDVVQDDGAVCRVGEPGELRVRSPQTFTEYFGDPLATAESFDAEGRFRTGDTGVVDADGAFKLLGRTSTDILKSGGYKLSALEIEDALREHDAIAEVAVIGVSDAEWGDAVTACCVLRPGAELDLEALRAWAKTRMASYKVPRALHVLATLPRTSLGKVQKKELAALLTDATSRP